MAAPTPTVVFQPLNAVGHVNASLGIADRLKTSYGFRTVFVVLGDVMSDLVRKHGHELIIVDEAEVHEDFEIEEGEDLNEPVDEQAKLAQGKIKKRYPGAFKWPQIVARASKIMRQEPLKALIDSIPMLEATMVHEIVLNHDRLAAAVSSLKPDLVVVDAYFIPPFIVRSDCLWVRLYSANPLQLTVSKLADGLKPPAMTGAKLFDKAERTRIRQEEPARWQAMLDEWTQANESIGIALSQVGGPLNELMVANGCEPLEPGQQAPDSPHLNIYIYPAALDYDQDDDLFEYKPVWFRCNSLIRQSANMRSSDEAWKLKFETAMSGKSEAIFFSLGSIASGDTQLVKRFIAMLAKDKKRLYVVSKGVHGDKIELDSGNMIGGNFIPQTFFLERVNLAIIHGGNNTITECLCYGVPMILVPCFADQFDNAQRVEDLGLGRRLDLYKCTEAELLGAVDALIANAGATERLKTISADIRAQDDPGKASYLIKRLIEDKKLDQACIEECRLNSFDKIVGKS